MRGNPSKIKPAFGVRRIDSVSDDPDHRLVGDETAFVHDRFCFQPDRRRGFDRRAQHVSCRQLRDTIFLRETRRLGAFSSAGRPKKNQPHLRFPRSLDFFTSPSY